MRKASILIISLVTAVLAEPAQAHTGHGTDGGITGLLHPLTGADHQLAMVLVGLWASVLAMQDRRSVVLLPLAFITAMIAGAALPFAGLAIPAVEIGILGSVVLLGLALLVAPRLSLVTATAVVAGFGALHGYAHGAEIPAGTSALAYGAGFGTATALLHGIGVIAGRFLLCRGWALVLRIAGVLAMIAGLAMATA